MAVGNMVGSSLFNLAILAGLDLAVRGKGRMLSRASAAHALSATMSMVLTALVGLAILARSEFSVGLLGPGSLGVLLAWVLGVRIIFYDQRAAREAAVEEGALPRPRMDAAARKRLGRAGLSTLAAAAVIFVAAPFVPEAAEAIAEHTGMTESFVGTTLVALSTSLPELATSAAAVRMGAYDLALGNVFGSNAFNMMIMLPLDLATPGPLLAGVSQVHAATCFWVIIITAVAVIGQLYRIEKRIALIEPDALLMLVLIVVALAGSAGGG
jgi:cation:H+ antiporter